MYQFPIVPCFAATTHKFQGGTVAKPNKLAVDLRTVFDDAMAYVMLSRIQDVNQLFIVGKLPEEKFRTSVKCLEELERLSNRSKNKNPSSWEKQDCGILKLSILNCHSLEDKIAHLKVDKMLLLSDVICLTETWIRSNALRQEYTIDGYKLDLNSYEEQRGKGIAIYYKENNFDIRSKIKLPSLQITKLSSPDIDIIALYRSASCHKDDFFLRIQSLMDPTRSTIICGDFNICFNDHKNSFLIQSLLGLGFEQKVLEATHIEGGLIDHVYVRIGTSQISTHVSLYSPYYTATDHDALCVEVVKQSKD